MVLTRKKLYTRTHAHTHMHTCSQDYFELGVVLTRKKLFTQATKNLEKAKKVWDGEESELAQVCNCVCACTHTYTRARTHAHTRVHVGAGHTRLGWGSPCSVLCRVL